MPDSQHLAEAGSYQCPTAPSWDHPEGAEHDAGSGGGGEVDSTLLFAAWNLWSSAACRASARACQRLPAQVVQNCERAERLGSKRPELSTGVAEAADNFCSGRFRLLCDRHKHLNYAVFAQVVWKNIKLALAIFLPLSLCVNCLRAAQLLSTDQQTWKSTSPFQRLLSFWEGGLCTSMFLLVKGQACHSLFFF